MKDEKMERFWSRSFEIAYRDCIEKITADEVTKKTEEFKFIFLNIELDEESVNKMLEIINDTKDLENEIMELYDICKNHSLKECAWNCECDYNSIRNLMFKNLVKTMDLVRKANLRQGEYNDYGAQKSIYRSGKGS